MYKVSNFIVILFDISLLEGSPKHINVWIQLTPSVPRGWADGDDGAAEVIGRNVK